jgi:hypothetical protein
MDEVDRSVLAATHPRAEPVGAQWTRKLHQVRPVRFPSKQLRMPVM